MSFRISGQKINTVKEARYLGLKLDQHLTFKQHMNTIKFKVNRANSLLAKIRYHVDSKLLKTIYSAIFESHLRFGSQLWGQAQIQLIENIQNKALQIINFKGPWESSVSLYKESKLFKLKDIVLLNNLQFVYDQINKNLPKLFHTFFYTQDGTTSTQYERKFPEHTTSENNNLWFQLSHMLCDQRLEQVTK